jgi:hypothetical protein
MEKPPPYSDGKVANREIRIWHLVIRNWMMDKSKAPRHKVDGGTIYNRAEGFGICPSFKDHFLSRRAKP